MLKIWKGIEQEGIGKSSEISTLFVCADEMIQYIRVVSYMQQNPDIKAVYLGAGRVPFCGMFGWERFIEYCKEGGIKILVEAVPEDFYLLYNRYNAKGVHFIVSYYNAPENMTNVYFKTDDVKVTRIFTLTKEVDISHVKDNMYPQDEVLCEEE